ncbi:MAG: (Fe-S)-binding protein [Deltaproteobacteria bacterium]|nr:(Fe-S)-binding protein [Deltaproteobacteria bacterium]MBW2009130.1 (Fe-S)-binding protein [Deltaproteobacteria bacterium]MBW2348044.1 (Fe-S)-binding protein [Deltaproteobacteria bacterium]RLB38110.1 MAG: hypothetical protein DRH20_06460 [Deltaproteobacteria bacterium]
MHELIDAGIVETIRTTGKTNANLPDRLEILKTHGLPYDREAENVVVTGCQILPLLPHIIASLARVLDRGGVSYTFLSEETCCGNYLYRPAIKARNDEAMEECRSLSREFVGQNVERARRLGAKRLVIFCSPCYPIYKHAFPDEEIVFYPRAIREAMGRARLESRVDYYAGCYRLHRKFSPVPMDLKSAEQVLDNIEGLEVNRISAPKCCFTPEGLSHMVDNVSTDLMVHICTGCYGQALQGLPKEKGTEVLMLPELVERARH